MSAPVHDALAEELGKHIFLEGWINPVEFDASDRPRCTCGHEYDNPNASRYYSHLQHVADALIDAGFTRVLTPAACEHDPRYSRSACGECGHQVAWCDKCSVSLCGCPLSPADGGTP